MYSNPKAHVRPSKITNTVAPFNHDLKHKLNVLNREVIVANVEVILPTNLTKTKTTGRSAV